MRHQQIPNLPPSTTTNSAIESLKRRFDREQMVQGLHLSVEQRADELRAFLVGVREWNDQRENPKGLMNRMLSKKLTARVDEKDAPDFDRLLGCLKKAGVSFLVVGSVSRVLQGAVAGVTGLGGGLPDLDVVYSRNPDQMEALAAALNELGAGYRQFGEVIEQIWDHDSLGSAHNLHLSTSSGVLHLFGSLVGAGPFESLIGFSIEMSAFGLTFPVLTLEAMTQLHLAAGRAKDFSSAAELQLVLEESNRLHS